MHAGTSNKRFAWLECLLLVALATVLRCLFIGKTDLGSDEAFSLYMAQLSLPDIVKLLCQGDNPPLWELLLHGWIALFGITEVAIRTLSLLFNVLTVIPIYYLGERHLHRFAGIAAALCYCCSTFSIYMAHECRVYSLIGLMTACSVWLFVSIIKEPKPYKFILLTLANLMLMYGHYLSIWVIVMEFVIVLTFKSIRKQIWKPYLIHAAVLICLYIPMFPVLFTRFMASGLHGTWVEKATGSSDLYDMFWRMCNVPLVTVSAILIGGAAFVKWVIRIKETRLETTGILTLLWLVPLLVSFVLSFFTGFLLDRYFYFLFPVFYLALAGYCLSLFPKRTTGGLVLMAVFTLMMAVTCSPDSSTKRFSGWHFDVKPIVKQLVEAKEEHAYVVLPENFDKQFVYYLDEDHEAFRTHRTPVSYYAFRDYLHQAGYHYDYEYPEADLSGYSRVVFPFEDHSAEASILP
ncbi:MAG: glycosyltransferase family 39 protein [Bacteroidales bacterium]|nr:glycosyltransferase family 39 protein [Bacteroidales bacterium]